MKKCVELLIWGAKFSEVALFARSNEPEMVSDCVKKWRGSLRNRKISESLADPEEYPNLFNEMLGKKKEQNGVYLCLWNPLLKTELFL
jgi:coatomer subunit beta'